MPVDPNALTLTQYAQMSNSPLVQAVTYSLIENGNVLQDIPFVNRQALIANGVRFEGDLPSVNWANINEEGATVSGTPKAFQEQAFIIRNYVDVDKLLVMDETQIVDPRATQVGIYLRSVTYDFNDKFINNAHSGAGSNKKAPVGLKARINNGSTYGVRSENKIAGGGVDLTLANRTVDSFNQFAELIDQLLWSVDSEDGTNVVLYMNDVMKRRWESSARRFQGMGGFATATDALGRTIERYKNATIRNIGVKADQSTRIITNTEAADGTDPGNSTHTSIYAVRYDTEHLFGWQYAPLAAQDLGLQDNGVIYRTLIDWAGGLYSQHTRSMARLHGIKLA